MANHPSAWKRIRQNRKKRLRNMSYRSQVKTAIKKYIRAVEEKDEKAKDLLREASSLLHRGVAKRAFHKNTASRTLSRLAKRLPQSSSADGA